MHIERQDGDFATEYAMKLKDLTTELSGNDSLRKRSVNIGPLGDRLNFIYGENGAGKSTIRRIVRNAFVDSSAASGALPNNDAMRLTIENAAGAYSIVRSQGGFVTTPLSPLGHPSANGVVGGHLGSAAPRLQIDRTLADNFSFVDFRHSGTQFTNLHAAIQQCLHVPVGKGAASLELGVSPQQIEELQARIGLLQNELSQLMAQRTSIEAEASSADHHLQALEIDRQIAELTSRRTQLDPIRIRQEIESLEQESARLRLEISRPSVTVSQVDPSAQVKLLYRLLDAIDQQIRESRGVQSSIQRHRVRLKEQLQQLGQLTIEEPGHPYHRAREILHQIEVRIDNADTRGDQWHDDHGTVDTQQVSRFLDVTCNSLRSDLQTLCDELSNQYHEIHSRSATNELKELRHTYAHLSDLIQQALSRRENVVAEIMTLDRTGGELIRREDAQYSEFAIRSGHYAARQKFLGAIEQPQMQVARDTSLQQQQLTALENRLAALKSSLSLADSEQLRLSAEIRDLETRKAGLSSVFIAARQERLNQVVIKIQSCESQIQTLSLQREQWLAKRSQPNPSLISAAGILAQLTNGDYTKVWLGDLNGSFVVQDRQGQEFGVEQLSERGLKQLVQLSLVLAANQQTPIDAPIMLDDLFAEVRKERVDAVLQTLSKWSHDRQRQIIVLTQHRFLADRISGSPVWEIEPAPATVNRRTESIAPVRPTVTVNHTVETRSTPASSFTAVVDSRQHEIHNLIADAVAAPVAEYPSSPMARPYPLSKYPRTTDRDRVSAAASEEYHRFDYHESFVQPEVQVAPTPASRSQNGFTEVNHSGRTSVISPAAVGDRYRPISISESTPIDTVTLFDNAQLRALEDHRIETVRDFMQLDSKSDAEDLSASYLVGQSLEFLQSAIWLMCWVPDLAENDAQALVACGISDPEHLLTSNIDSLFERLSRFLRSPDGRRFGGAERSLSRNAVRSWQFNLRNNREYSQRSRPRSGNVSQRQNRSTGRQTLRAWNPNEQPQSRRESRPKRHERRHSDDRDRDRPSRQAVRQESLPARAPRMQTHRDSRPSIVVPRVEPRVPKKPAAVRQTATRQSLTGLAGEAGFAEPSSEISTTSSKPKTSTSKLRFYLELSDHIEAAPSIGPKTGARFEAIGVHTISDFLKMTAETMAERLDYKRLNAKVLREWQDQSRLVCRIPNLRGHDAQLLVGCDIKDPEEIATMRPESLFAKIAPFSDTKEGLKIIRNGKKPDLAEITDWISFAQHNRSLQAA